MSTDRPDRFSDRIAELWNDRPRADRSPDRRAERLSFDELQERPEANPPLQRPNADRPSLDRPALESLSPDRPSPDRPFTDRLPDHPADRFTARFADLEPLTPVSSPSVPASSLSASFAPDLGPIPTPGPDPHSNLKTSPGPSPVSTPAQPTAPASSSGPIRVRSWAPQPYQPTPRAVGSPLPTGSAPASAPSSQAQLPSHRATSPAQPNKPLALGRGLPSPESALAQLPPDAELPSGVQKVINAVRATLPFIQRILPLLDGNIGTAVSNLMAPPPPPAHRPAPPPSPVDLAPLEEGISSLQTQQRELRTQIVEQNTSLKRVEDQLEMVREATDRNTLEQQELLEDLKGIGNKVNIFAMVALLLLVVSVMVNVILYLHIKRVLP